MTSLQDGREPKNASNDEKIRRSFWVKGFKIMVVLIVMSFSASLLSRRGGSQTRPSFFSSLALAAVIGQSYLREQATFVRRCPLDVTGVIPFRSSFSLCM